ncbi:sensor histidine kinase [Phytoactinopolyspora halotolerans]|uniref:Sensor histidine kinase n=1 Tax=Phytoactinopolyspora halotolerans TaxID=1981512 RepID=A0A6L9S193_9ACTN|nr:sensor histidine kinase [Phytoactinopolyspora halotolerans]NED98590.1 sensor histidine kinase [Phytoactinopolyspora halotolerans]
MEFTRSGPRRVDLYNRVSMYGLIVIEPVLALALIGQVSVDAPSHVLISMLGLSALHAIACLLLLRASMRYRLGAAPRPDLLRVVAGVVTLAGVAMVQVWREYLELSDPDTPDLGYMALAVLLVFYGGPLAAGMPARDGRWLALAGLAALLGIGWTGGHVPSGGAAPTVAVIWAFVAAFFASTFPTFVWISKVLWELDRSRETEARLAVAEERLRFARDLHDVLGRNLSVVALKSQLTGKLIERDPDEAARQAEEVRRLAESSLKEVRDVVRGYRATDLDTELAGSRAVLEAAGVRCTITGAAEHLPPDVQSTLAWVVREGTTNVLRHSDATRCVITLGRDGGTVMLTMENDRVRDSSAGAPGNGLVGLRERVQAAGGTLGAGTRPDGTYRLTTTLPVDEQEQP